MPGPGAYSSGVAGSGNSTGGFAKSKREMDIRTCILYVDRNTKDYFCSF